MFQLVREIARQDAVKSQSGIAILQQYCSSFVGHQERRQLYVSTWFTNSSLATVIQERACSSTSRIVWDTAVLDGLPAVKSFNVKWRTPGEFRLVALLSWGGSESWKNVQRYPRRPYFSSIMAIISAFFTARRPRYLKS